MKRDKRQPTFINLGSASLLVIFLVLSLVTFAVLALVSAVSDYNLSRKQAEYKAAYYEANVKAEEILADIDEYLAKLTVTDGWNEVVDELEEKQLREVSLSCQIQEGETEPEVIYQIPVSEKQALQVILKLHKGEERETEIQFSIAAWQVISTQDWEGNQTLQLLPMGE